MVSNMGLFYHLPNGSHDRPIRFNNKKQQGSFAFSPIKLTLHLSLIILSQVTSSKLAQVPKTP